MNDVMLRDLSLFASRIGMKREEYCAHLFAGRKWRARAVLLRGYVSISLCFGGANRFFSAETSVGYMETRGLGFLNQHLNCPRTGGTL